MVATPVIGRMNVSGNNNMSHNYVNGDKKQKTRFGETYTYQPLRGRNTVHLDAQYEIQNQYLTNQGKLPESKRNMNIPTDERLLMNKLIGNKQNFKKYMIPKMSSNHNTTKVKLFKHGIYAPFSGYPFIAKDYTIKIGNKTIYPITFTEINHINNNLASFYNSKGQVYSYRGHKFLNPLLLDPDKLDTRKLRHLISRQMKKQLQNIEYTIFDAENYLKMWTTFIGDILYEKKLSTSKYSSNYSHDARIEMYKKILSVFNELIADLQPDILREKQILEYHKHIPKLMIKQKQILSEQNIKVNNLKRKYSNINLNNADSSDKPKKNQLTKLDQSIKQTLQLYNTKIKNYNRQDKSSRAINVLATYDQVFSKVTTNKFNKDIRKQTTMLNEMLKKQSLSKTIRGGSNNTINAIIKNEIISVKSPITKLNTFITKIFKYKDVHTIEQKLKALLKHYNNSDNKTKDKIQSKFEKLKYEPHTELYTKYLKKFNETS